MAIMQFSDFFQFLLFDSHLSFKNFILLLQQEIGVIWKHRFLFIFTK